MAEFLWLAPLVLGLIIGLIELFFVHADESGMGWLNHGFHAIPVCVFLTFISMNVPFVVNKLGIGFLSGPVGDWGIPILIGIIATIKVKAAAAIAKGGSIGEKLSHALIIGALIACAPLLWHYLAPTLPAFLNK